MAPEVFRHEPYNSRVDVYSFSMIVYQLFEVSGGCLCIRGQGRVFGVGHDVRMQVQSRHGIPQAQSRVLPAPVDALPLCRHNMCCPSLAVLTLPFVHPGLRGAVPAPFCRHGPRRSGAAGGFVRAAARVCGTHAATPNEEGACSWRAKPVGWTAGCYLVARLRNRTARPVPLYTYPEAVACPACRANIDWHLLGRRVLRCQRMLPGIPSLLGSLPAHAAWYSQPVGLAAYLSSLGCPLPNRPCRRCGS